VEVEVDWDALRSSVTYFLSCCCLSDWVRFVRSPNENIQTDNEMLSEYSRLEIYVLIIILPHY
jgi:hypothetical protein